jgi:hypothetical protein
METEFSTLPVGHFEGGISGFLGCIRYRMQLACQLKEVANVMIIDELKLFLNCYCKKTGLNIILLV